MKKHIKKIAVGVGIGVTVAGIGGILAWDYLRDLTSPTKIALKERSKKVDELKREAQILANRIKSANGTGACSDSWDCRIVGLGQRVCDGFANFLVYSTRDTDEPFLLGLVSKFNSAQTTIQDLSFEVPNCGKKPPTVFCNDGRCESK